MYSSGFVTGTSGHPKIPIVVGRFTRFSTPNLLIVDYISKKLHTSTATPRLWYVESDYFCGDSKSKSSIRFITHIYVPITAVIPLCDVSL